MLARSLALAAALLLPLFPVLAQDCVEYQPQEMFFMDFLSMDAYVSYDLELIGDVAFVGTSSGIYSVDVSDPQDLTVIGYYEQFGCIELAIIDNLICVSSQDDGLIFVDATDPANMTHVRTYSEHTYSQRAIAHGDYFYIGNNHLGVIVVDATDRTDPQVVYELPVDQRVVTLGAYGNTLYTVSYDSQVVVISLVNPAQPYVVRTLGGYHNGRGHSFFVNAPYMYMPTYNDRLNIYYLGNPENPTLAGYQTGSDRAYGMAMMGETLFLAGYNTVRAMDATMPQEPVPIGRMISNTELWSLKSHGDHLLGVAEDSAIFSLDVSQPESTLPLRYLETGGAAQDVTFCETDFGYYMMVSNGPEGLYMKNVDGGNPVATYPTLGDLLSITVDGTRAYLAMDDAGLQIVDVNYQHSPAFLDDIDTPGHCRDVAIYENASGKYALVADTEYDVVKYDVTDPTWIRPKGVNYFPGHVYDVEVLEDRLLVADDSGDLHIMDLSVLPDQPSDPITLEVGGTPRTMALMGTILLMGGSQQISTVDLVDPDYPVLLDSLDLPVGISDIQVQGGVAYCVTPLGMQMVNVSEPTDLRLMSSYREKGSTFGVGVHGKTVYLAAGESGIVYLPLQCSPVSSVEEVVAPCALVLGQAYPNPFNPLTTIRYELPRAMPVTLSIIDLAGRRVSELLSGQMKGVGPHQAQWNGRDDRGRAAPAGIYLYRLQAGSIDETRRMVLIK